jgi:hypothetical protein
MSLNCCKLHHIFTSFLASLRSAWEYWSRNVEIIFPESHKTSALQTDRQTDMFNMAAFYDFKAIPGSPWALIRHHEQKGRVQAFTIHNRTDKKKKTRKESRKQAVAGERNKRITLTYDFAITKRLLHNDSKFKVGFSYT